MRFVFGILKVLGIVLVVAVFVGGGAYWYLSERALTAHGERQEDSRFSIGRGEGVTALAKRLEDEGIIDSRLTFMVYAIKTGDYKNFQIGEYRLSGKLSIPEIIERFIAGKVVPAGVRVTFPEGWKMSEMAERLTENQLPGAEFLTIAQKPFPKWRERYAFLATLPVGMSLEGYLFPDTYIFPPSASGELIVNELLKNFGDKAAPIILKEATRRKLSFHEVVTFASIVEEEGRTESDRKNISDVFRKRLLVGQPLQSDATVNYVHGTAKDQPTLKDLESDSPYNTYVHVGLPPGPIGNPSIMSIQATLFPTSNPYYYFLIDIKTRTTYFAQDFEGHQKNRLLYGL